MVASKKNPNTFLEMKHSRLEDPVWCGDFLTTLHHTDQKFTTPHWDELSNWGFSGKKWRIFGIFGTKVGIFVFIAFLEKLEHLEQIGISVWCGDFLTTLHRMTKMFQRGQKIRFSDFQMKNNPILHFLCPYWCILTWFQGPFCIFENWAFFLGQIVQFLEIRKK